MAIRIVCAEADMKTASSLARFLKKQNIPTVIGGVMGRTHLDGGASQIVLWSNHLAPYKKRLKDLPNSQLVILDGAGVPPELSSLDRVDVKSIGMRENRAWRDVAKMVRRDVSSEYHDVAIDRDVLPKAAPISLEETSVEVSQDEGVVAAEESLVEVEVEAAPTLESVEDLPELDLPELDAEIISTEPEMESVSEMVEADSELEEISVVEADALPDLDSLDEPIIPAEPEETNLAEIEAEDFGLDTLETPLELDLGELVDLPTPDEVETIEVPDVQVQLAEALPLSDVEKQGADEEDTVAENLEEECEPAATVNEDVLPSVEHLELPEAEILEDEFVVSDSIQDEAIPEPVPEQEQEVGQEQEVEPVSEEVAPSVLDEVPSFSELSAAHNVELPKQENKTFIMPVLVLIVLIFGLGGAVGLLHPDSPFHIESDAALEEAE